jgi:hypothetical protein
MDFVKYHFKWPESTSQVELVMVFLYLLLMLVGTYQIAAIPHAGIIVDEWFVNYKTQNLGRPKGHAYWYYH